jgi:hypothetical protein
MDGDLFRQCLVVGFVRRSLEHRLDRLAEELGDAKGERQARIVFASFDGVHGLARHSESVRQFTLGPFTLGAKNTKPVFHGALTRIRWPPMIVHRQLAEPIAPSWHSRTDVH